MHQSGHGHGLGGRPRSMERGVPRNSAEFRNEDGERGTQMDTCTTRTSKVETLRIDAERGTKFELFLEILHCRSPPSFLRTLVRAAQYRMMAMALPAGQAAVDDSAPSNFSALLTRWVFRADPWLQRAFEAEEKLQDETTGADTFVTVPRPSNAGYDSTRMFSFSTARWHQWKDLPAKAGLVVSNAHEVGVDVAPGDWFLLQSKWRSRHDNAIPGAIHSLCTERYVILATAPGRLLVASSRVVTLR
jgi:hypothetical protein